MDWRRVKDSLSSRFMYFSLLLVNAIVLSIFIGLLVKSSGILGQQSITDLLFLSSWMPSNGQFGLFPYIIGTLSVTAIAMAIAIPVCILSAIYISEYASSRMRRMVSPVIDLLAGIPSVVYGLWGVLTIVPIVHSLAGAFGIASTGYSLLAGGITLAIMVFPIIISIAVEVFRAVPYEARETTMALGATKWETARHVVVKAALPGVVAAVVFGFARAFGETMAVIMVVGNVAKIPTSLFDPVYPIPALIANNYGEMMSIPSYDSALMFAALVLFVIVAAFTVLAHFSLSRIKRRLAA
jgi:phosphate transport system permease protein